MNISESYRKRMQELAGIKTNSEDILYGLKKHAKFFDNYEDFENFYSIKGNHGIYYHITNTPNFQISQQTGPRDMSSMSSGSISEKGALMVTSDLEYWDEYYNSYDPDTPEDEDVKRNYVAIIDLSEIKPSKLNPTQRGFGHEIYLKPDDAKKAKIIKVLNIQDARKFNDNFNKIKPNSSKELKKLWDSVRKNSNNTLKEHNILDYSPEEIIKYVGNDTSGFNSRQDAIEELEYLLSADFPDGLKNIPNEVILYRVVLIKSGEIVNEDEVGEHFVADPQFIDRSFLEKIGVMDNWGDESTLWLLKCLTSKDNIDIERTIGNRLLYPRENEFTVFNGKKIKVTGKKEVKKSKLSLSENINPNDDFIFHGTNTGAAYHIQKYGGMKLNAARNNEPYISFTSDLKVAQYYAQMKGGTENGIILRIKRTPDFSLSPKFKKNKGHEWITTREIPLKELEIETPNGWVSLENWDIIDKKVMALSENNLPDMQSMLSKYKLRYPKDNVLIIVNINKLLARHKHDEPDYAFDSKETSDYPGRVDRAKEYWTNYANDPRPISPKDGTRNDWGDMTFEAPYVSIYNGKLGFSDGRHRVIAMKELGYDDIVIEVPKDQIHQFMELK